MRRLLALLLTALGALALLPGLAAAEEVVEAGATGAIVLAVDDAPAGPEPAPRDAEENPARELGGFEDREVPFTWGAAWLLAGAFFVGVVLMVAFYRFRVVQADKDRAST